MSDFTAGRHEAQIASLDGRVGRVEKTVNAIDEKLDGVLVLLAEKRGERKMIALMATAAGGMGSLVITLLLKLWEHQ